VNALKNLLILGASVMCWLTAFNSVQSLQSSLNHRRTLGVASLAGLYAAAVVSCFYSPVVIRRLSAKWTIVAALGVHLSYVAANFDESGTALVPTAVAAGALTGPLWSPCPFHLPPQGIKAPFAMHLGHSKRLVQQGRFRNHEEAYRLPGAFEESN